MRELVVGSGAAAVFPVYSLAPEAKYPTQVEQNYAVARWIMREGAAHAMDASRFAVCEGSSGGNMSAVLALMAKERGDVRLAAQVLLYPTVDANFETPSYLQFADHYYNTLEAMRWFWDQYTNDPAQRTEPSHTMLDVATRLPGLGSTAGRGRVRCDSSPLSCAGPCVPGCSAVHQDRWGSTEKLRGKPMQGLATSTMVLSEVSPMFHECRLGYPTP